MKIHFLAYAILQEKIMIKRELLTGKGFADLVFRPRKNNGNPATIVELKYDKSDEGAIDQIKKKV